MNGERGYTLVETLVAIVITAVVVGALGMAVQQMLTVPEKNDDQVEALHDLQNVIHWVGLDGESAKSAVGGNSLTLTLPDDSTVSYGRVGDTLYRYNGAESRAVARNITEMNFTVNGRIITMEITAAPDSRWDVSESHTYQVAMRPSGI